MNQSRGAWMGLIAVLLTAVFILVTQTACQAPQRRSKPAPGSTSSSVTVLFASQMSNEERAWSEAKTLAYEAFGDASVGFSNIDALYTPPSPKAYFGNACDIFYLSPTSSNAKCGGITDILRAYAKKYREDPDNIDRFQTDNVILYVANVDVYLGAYKFGQSTYGWPRQSGATDEAAYVFDSEVERFLTDVRPDINLRSSYKKNVVAWCATHELGHLLADLTEWSASSALHKSTLNYPDIMDSPDSIKIVSFYGTFFCSDADADTTNSCVDNIKSALRIKH